MNRERRIAVWVATFIGLVVAWKLFGQGFGSFTRDQPFLAANPTTAPGETWPQSAELIAYFDTRSVTNVITNGVFLTNWVNKANSIDPATNTLTVGAADIAPKWADSGGVSNFGYVSFWATNWLSFYPRTNGTGVTAPFTVGALLTFDFNEYQLYSISAGTYGASLIANASWGMLYEGNYSPVGVNSMEGNRPPGSVLVGIGVPPLSSWLRIVATYGTNFVQLWTNGVFVGGATNTMYAFSPETIYIGSRYLTYHFAGRMHRFMLWHGILTSNECITVDGMIKEQFGL